MNPAIEQGINRAKARMGQFFQPETRATWGLRTFGLTKVPLLLACTPTVIRLDEAACVVEIPLTWRTRNHFRSMYFGALAIGADSVVGMLAMHHIDLAGGDVQLLFKDFQANFLRRPEGDVHFTCNDGAQIAELVAEAKRTGERGNLPVALTATVPSHGPEPVATFVLTLSVKRARKA